MKRTLMSSKQVSRNKPKKALNRRLRQCEHTRIQTQWERKRVFIVPLWHLNKCAHFLHVYWTYLCVCVCVSGRSLWRPTCATCSQTLWGSSTLPSPLVSWRCVVVRSCLFSSPPSWWPWWSAIITTTGRRWRRSVCGLIICTCTPTALINFPAQGQQSLSSLCVFFFFFFVIVGLKSWIPCSTSVCRPLVYMWKICSDVAFKKKKN